MDDLMGGEKGAPSSEVIYDLQRYQWSVLKMRRLKGECSRNDAGFVTFFDALPT